MTPATLGYGDLSTNSERDELGFASSAAALAAIVQDADLDDTPLTIGIYGPWGSGKTSMMRMIQEKLDEHSCIPVWFDAWRYAQHDTLWRALLISVVESIRERIVPDDDRLRTLIAKNGSVTPENLSDERARRTQRLDDLIDGLYRSVEREELGNITIDWAEAGKATARSAIRLGLAALPIVGNISKALEEIVKAAQGETAKGEEIEAFAKALRRERAKTYREHIRSLEQFHRELEALIKEWVLAAGYRLVIFIDDLDRCLPEQAISVLEATKVFLGIRGCVFILGMDRAIIEHGIRVRYKEFALHPTLPANNLPIGERDYLEKIVQIPFTLSPLAPRAISTFLHHRLPHIPGLSDDERQNVAALMTIGLERNPRKVKRTLNIFRLHLRLDRAQNRQTPAGLIAKLTVIQNNFADIYDHIAHDPTKLRDFEAIAIGTRTTIFIPEDLRNSVSDNQRLSEMLRREPWYKNLADEALRQLVYQSQTTNDSGAA